MRTMTTVIIVCGCVMGLMPGPGGFLSAQDREAENAETHTERGANWSSNRLANVGDESDVRVLSPVSVLSNVHVSVQIFFGPPPSNDAGPSAEPKTGAKPRRQERKASSERLRRKVRRKIRRWDDNGDRRISREEFRHVSGQGAAGRFDRWDTDAGGFLSVEEIVEASRRRRSP